MNEYLIGAHKLLALYGYNCHKRDEDAISSVASAMMKADQTWDGKSSSRDTWRFNQARYAIMKLKTQHKKKRKIVSLNNVVYVKSNRTVYLQDLVEDKKKGNVGQAFDELMTQAKNHLSQRQFECLKLHYKEDMTMEKIGDQLGITKQMVSLHIKKAVQILQNECPSKVDYITS
jgi:RNA polymerase sigma factor (sigma-70 family)